MTEQQENALNHLLEMVQSLDASAACDGANDCHPSIGTERIYDSLAIALRQALTAPTLPLAAKDATHEKQLNAHKSLIQSLENQRTTLREGAEKWAEAVKSLLSEREANSLLTNEIDALTAERDDLRIKIAIIRQDSNREFEDYRIERDQLRVALLDIARLKTEGDALRKDAERLDWLDQNIFSRENINFMGQLAPTMNMWGGVFTKRPSRQC